MPPSFELLQTLKGIFRNDVTQKWVFFTPFTSVSHLCIIPYALLSQKGLPLPPESLLARRHLLMTPKFYKPFWWFWVLKLSKNWHNLLSSFQSDWNYSFFGILGSFFWCWLGWIICRRFGCLGWISVVIWWHFFGALKDFFVAVVTEFRSGNLIIESLYKWASA